MALENDGGASQIQVPVASALPWLLLVRSRCHIWRGISCNRVVEASGLLWTLASPLQHTAVPAVNKH